jgi:hypothetical protein
MVLNVDAGGVTSTCSIPFLTAGTIYVVRIPVDPKQLAAGDSGDPRFLAQKSGNNCREIPFPEHAQ